MTQLEKIKKELERVGVHVDHDDDDENPTLTARRKPGSKKFMFDLVFDKKGRLINLVVGLRETKCCWLDVKGIGRLA